MTPSLALSLVPRCAVSPRPQGWSLLPQRVGLSVEALGRGPESQNVLDDRI
jgi:hypothetical protein